MTIVEKTVERLSLPIKCMENEDDMYEYKYTDFFIELIKKCKSFVDVGANYGYYTCLAHENMPKNSTIYSFEANPMKFGNLYINNRIYNSKSNFNTTMKCIAISNTTEKNIKFYLPDDDNQCSGGLYHNRNHNDKYIEVETDTLDNIIKDNPVDLIKIDVEGAEVEVLEGAINIIKNQKPIIMMEVHKFVPELDINKLSNILNSNGYKFIQLASQWYIFINEDKKTRELI